MCARVCSGVSNSATPLTVDHQAPLSMEFSRQEYWSGLPFPTPGDLSNPGIEPVSFVCSALAGGFFTTAPLGSPRKVLEIIKRQICSEYTNIKGILARDVEVRTLV